MRSGLPSPKGARKKGSGKIVSILHPMAEKNPACGATLTVAKLASLQIPVAMLNNDLGEQFDGLMEPEASGQNPSDLKAKWEALKKRVADFIDVQKNALKKRKKNYTEQVKTSDGKTVFINVDESRGKWRAEGYPVIGGRIKRVGRPRVAIGETESEAYDKLVMSLERNPKSKIKNRKSAKRNLDEIDQAADLTEQFQGRPAEKVVETVKGNKMRDDFSHLGWQEQFVFVPPSDSSDLDCRAISDYYNERYEAHSDTARAWREVQKKFDFPILVYDVDGDKIELVASADGKQIYFLGKKQAAFGEALKDFRTDLKKDRVDMGQLLSVTYTAQKTQAGDTEERGYYHVFGEEGGYPPRAFFDTLNKEINLVGGTYHLNDADAGIRN